MGLGSELEHADHFAAYVNELTKVLGHADREKPFRDYCAGLLATEGRRSVEPMPGGPSEIYRAVLSRTTAQPNALRTPLRHVEPVCPPRRSVFAQIDG
jgi:SRSO17 transposase